VNGDARRVGWGLVAVALLQTALEWMSGQAWLEDWLALDRAWLLGGEVWRVATYALLHGAPGEMLLRAIHLAVNAGVIVAFGKELEAAGDRRCFWWALGVGVVAGGLAHVATSAAPVVGASAGALAVLGAFAARFPRVELVVFAFFVLPVRLRAMHLLAGIAGLSLVMLIFGIYPAIGHAAHLGGCAAGWAIGAWKKPGATPGGAARKPWPGVFGGEPGREEMDRILDKVAAEGIHALTSRERKVLERIGRRSGR
jgi:membrane associated rhomboid family serine protease